MPPILSPWIGYCKTVTGPSRSLAGVVGAAHKPSGWRPGAGGPNVRVGMTAQRTAMVTGASRGLGRGIALALVDAGYRVVGTGRSIAEANLPEAVERIVCDHRDDAQTARAFAAAGSDLDLLVNAAWGG